MIPFVCMMLFVGLAWYDSIVQKTYVIPSLSQPLLAKNDTLYYPQLTTILGTQTNASEAAQTLADPAISAYGAVVIDDDSKVMVYGKNENVPFIPASTTKMMTALVALDQYGLDDVLEYRYPAAVGSMVGLTAGEKMTFRSLLYALLLPSGNDAALTLAQNYPGGVDAFVGAMNKKAADLHLQDTHFVEPSGISALNLTTPLDLATIGSEVMRSPVLSEIVGTKAYVVSDITGKNVYPIENINKLLGVYGIDGIKTGFTDEAGEVLVTSRDIDGHRLVIVVMHSNDRFADTRTLIQNIAENTTYQPIHF